MAKWKLVHISTGATVQTAGDGAQTDFPDGVVPRNPAGKPWRWVRVEESETAEKPDMIDANPALAFRALASIVAQKMEMSYEDFLRAIRMEMALLKGKEPGNVAAG